MQFWATSALLPLVVQQPPFSDPCRRAFRLDGSRAVAFLARVECRSAIERLGREGTFDAAARRRALTKLDRLLAAFDIVAFSADAEAHALALLSRHSLRTLDALQLGCALALKPRSATPPVPQFACCDRKLATAATGEGLSLAVTV